MLQVQSRFNHKIIYNKQFFYELYIGRAVEISSPYVFTPLWEIVGPFYDIVHTRFEGITFFRNILDENICRYCTHLITPEEAYSVFRLLFEQNFTRNGLQLKSTLLDAGYKGPFTYSSSIVRFSAIKKLSFSDSMISFVIPAKFSFTGLFVIFFLRQPSKSKCFYKKVLEDFQQLVTYNSLNITMDLIKKSRN